VILPSKHIPVRQSLLGLGAIVLEILDQPRTLTELWELARSIPEMGTFRRLILCLDLLYALGCITLEGGLLKRARP
jgi:hypothetical protein